MKYLLLIATSILFLSNTIAADAPASLKPGRFLLVTNGDFYLPATLVDILKADDNGLKITSNENSKMSAPIIKDEGSYVFRFTIPGKGGVPSSDQYSPKNYYVTYAGSVSNLPHIALQGVCSAIITYPHSTTTTHLNSDSEAQVGKGTFILYSITKTEQDAAANP